MPSIRFYQQQRLDGGTRTGLGIDDVQAFHHFEEGAAEHDPALLWYLDLIFDGEKLPGEAEKARCWLREQSEPLTKALRTVAGELKLGMDEDALSLLQRRLTGFGRGVSARILISALRRLPPGELAGKLTRLARDWSATLDALEPMAVVDSRS